ncbi:MAG: hypothetical protein QNJ68_18170 [Microcoleaceae cyanobacterium MO_207.B10]|nr:hypothetical protein [Microcoleaceae cyanobacterium MO_207.B10]
MFATNIINLGFWVWSFRCGEIRGKTKKNAGYQRDKAEKLD